MHYFTNLNYINFGLYLRYDMNMTLTAEEIKKLQDALTSDATANNPKIFATKAEIEAGYKPIFKKTKEERFIVVEDSFFDPIRELSK